MRIDDGIKREVLARTDLGEFIGQYVPLRKRGNDLVGLCPFHAERTPSFHVHPDRGFFKCFGCGASGDAISFVQQHEGLTFPDALGMLARRLGIELEAENPATTRARGEKEAIYAANALAAAYFARLLRTSTQGERARAYAASRDLREETLAEFKLGYAPAGWDGLVRELGENGVELELAARAGLVRHGERGYYDFYRDRLMIPTLATTGEVVAFGGRALDGSEPKYLNTSTTPVYTKGRGLFALDRARRAAAKVKALIVVEGYLDCIALHQAGFTHAVAALGTAFTAEQATQLRKYVPHVFVCFDADAAGDAAALKSIETLLDAGFGGYGISIVTLPAGEDPDSVVRGAGAPAFQKLLDEAVPWIRFRLDRDIDGLGLEGLGPAEIARRAEARVRLLPREEWDRWRVYVAGRLGLAIDDLRVAAARLPYGPISRDLPAGANRAARTAPEPPSLERDLLGTLLEEPALIREYAGSIGPERFASEAYRALYLRLVERASELERPSDVQALFRDEPAAIATALGLQAGEGATRFTETTQRRARLDRIVEHLAQIDDERHRNELARRIDARYAAGETIAQEEKDEYQHLVERVELAKRRRLGTKPH
ncbi:MAG: DNA primase [Candidatus Baltobacteraceae bacterium]